ncbi:XRE family transcriptional regulator [Hymenobacter nivis]|uniref:Helix-turn-helix domain-containing protein n=1 Tax=Hymenobacter nivis TaxID=1850093 RepID=A0A502GXK4_9BACT|nr:helix-turn-helix domain-containing protein [Hymenobacter nivis]TPG66098.1 helix-turn-helix domain-containing protein [Hymenobacter nivis]
MTDGQRLSGRLKLLRKGQKITQDELAARLGLTKSAISKFETGNSAPSFETLKKIATLYNVSTDYLLNGSNSTFVAQAQNISLYPAGQNNVQAVALLSDIPTMWLRRVSFKARASFNYAHLQRYMSSDVFDTVLFRLPPGKTEADYADAIVFDIEGDSMEPSLYSGQQVIAWPVPDSKWEYLHNTICVVDYDDTVTVKAVRSNDLNNRDGLTLHATGGAGGYFIVAREHIHSIWEVREFYGLVPVRLLS